MFGKLLCLVGLHQMHRHDKGSFYTFEFCAREGCHHAVRYDIHRQHDKV